MNYEVQKITKLSDENLNIIVDWMYKWWGKTEGYSIDELNCYILNSLQSDRLPLTYGIFDNKKIIAIYQFTYSDLDSRPDIYPWLANVYVDEQYRNKGIGKLLIESVKENIKHTNFKEIYLYTPNNNFYEKYGFDFIGKIDTFKCNPRIQNLYKFEAR